MNGVVNFFKESGMTSMQAVSKIRRTLDVKTAGHMGTLDPLAYGVLPVGLGKAARLFDFYLKKSKEYIAGFVFGFSTDTLDITGAETVRNGFVPEREDILQALCKLRGKIMQIPPAYSAKHIGGERAYDLSRKGMKVELAPCAVEINAFEMLEKISDDAYRFRIDCSAGTYIRSLARDLGELTGSLCVMQSLCRTRSGEFRIEDSVKLEELSADKVVPVDSALTALPAFTAPDSFYKNISNGVPCAACGLPEGLFRLYCKGEFFGLATEQNGRIKITTFLKD